MSSVIALSYSSKINGFLYPQRVSQPLKKNDMICSQKAMLLFQSGVTSHCCQYDDFWRTSSFKKGAPNGHYYLQRSVAPDQVFQQNREGPIGNGPHAPLPYDALKVGSCSTVYTALAVL
jgi:hypothetical protein